jgi:hypothetical protein
MTIGFFRSIEEPLVLHKRNLMLDKDKLRALKLLIKIIPGHRNL